MSKLFYLLNGKSKTGPFSLLELPKQEIYEETLVWNEDLTEWKKASEVDEVKLLIKKQTPKPPLTPAEINATKNKEVFLKSLITALVCLIVLAFAAFIIMGGFASDSYLIRTYNLNSNYYILAGVSEVRFTFIPLSSFVFLSLPISLLILFFIYRIEKIEDEKEKKLVKDVVAKSIACVVIFLALGLFIMSNFIDSLTEYFTTEGILPYSFYIVALVNFLLFLLLYSQRKNECKTQKERPTTN